MGRLKKRVQRRLKKQVKQSIKKPKTQTKTPEQQAKENEMLKVMLSRQPQLIAGQGEKNDKLQQQLDLQKNVLIQKQKEFQTQQEQLRQYKAEMDKMKSEINQAKAKNDNQEKINREKEKGVVKLEKEEKRKQKLEDKEEELDERKREFDETTAEGKHKIQMTEAEIRNKQLKQSIEDKKREYNAMNRAAEIEAAKAENERLQAYLTTIENAMKSEEFKNQGNTIKELYKTKLETEDKIKHAERVKKTKEDIINMKAQEDAFNEYINEMEDIEPERDRNGKVRKDKDGYTIFKDSKIDENRKAYAEQLKNKIDVENNFKQVENKMNYYKNIGEEVNKMKFENEQLKKKYDELVNLTEGNYFKNHMRMIEEEKQLEENKKRQLDFQKQSIQAKQKIQELEAQLEIGEQYDLTKTDLPGVQTQIRELSKIGNETFENNNTIIQNNINLNKQKQAYDAAYDNLLNRYVFKDNRDTAEDNLLKLMEQKIGATLPKNTNDWDIKNLERATAFTEMIGKLTPDLLLKPDMLNDFVKGDEFNNFNWNIV